MKKRHSTTVKNSPIVHQFQSRITASKLDVRVLAHSANYAHLMVVDSKIIDQVGHIPMVAEASLRDGFVSIAVFDEDKVKSKLLHADLKSLLTASFIRTQVLQ